LVYSGYLVGTSGTSVGQGVALGLAADGSSNAYAVGYTSGACGFPTTAGAYQTAVPNGTQTAFVSKISGDGTTLAYSTFLGGATSDAANAVAVDVQGEAFVTGTTSSNNFPTSSGAAQTTLGGSVDAFVTKVNAAGSGLGYSSYLGGSGSDAGNGIALDPAGGAAVVGQTSSSNFPTVTGAFQSTFGSVTYDAFVTRFVPAGTSLAASSYLGRSSGTTVATRVATIRWAYS
jgi:Beta-propeller repeat